MSAYSSALFPQHVELLAASAVSPKVAHARGYQSVDTKSQLKMAGFSKAQQNPPGLLIPVWGVDGTIRFHQYRPDTPRLLDSGKTRKYETPARVQMALDVPPPARDRIGDPSVPLFITEGARKADAAVTAGLCCVALLGVWNWRGTNAAGGKAALSCWESVALNGRDVYVVFDSDVMLIDNVQLSMKRLGTFLADRGAHVRPIYLPHGAHEEKTGLDDYLAAGHSVDDLLELARDLGDDPADAEPERPPPPPPQPRTLADTVATFRRWLHLNDPAALYALAAALVANRAPGDPVWLLLVCAPSTGKTELLGAAADLPWVIPAAKVTEASLLSGTSKKERAKGATGGLLRQVGDFGVLLAKDFTSVLAQNRDTRAEALAALREVYDGSWHRPVGTDGGRVLTWKGKCGLVGAVTPALDRYHGVISTLGDRFLLLRMPDVDAAKAGDMALTHLSHEPTMREELAGALVGLVEHADTSTVDRELSDDEKALLVRLATFTARARTGVERDGYTQEVLYLPQVEGPGRLVLAYARLRGGLEAIGCDPTTTWRTLARVAVDCVPAVRTTLIREMFARELPARTSDVAAEVGMVTKTASRHLEDLALLGVAERSKSSDAPNAPDLWAASDWLRDFWPDPESETEMYPPPHKHNKEESTGTTTEGHGEGDDEDPTRPYVHFGPTFNGRPVIGPDTIIGHGASAPCVVCGRSTPAYIGGQPVHVATCADRRAS